MAGSNQSAGAWPVVVVQTDTLEAVPWTVTRNGSPWTPTGATARVRQNRDRSSGQRALLTTAITTGVITGFGDVIALPPGTYYWELRVSDTAISATYSRTLLAGEFVVLPDAEGV